MGWRDHITHGSFKRVHRDGHAACSTPSDMSGPPTPVHTSSPLRTQERYYIYSSTKREGIVSLEGSITAKVGYSMLTTSELGEIPITRLL